MGSVLLGYKIGGSPHPAIVTIMDSRDYIKVFLYS